MTIIVICFLGCTSKENLNNGFYIKSNYLNYSDSLSKEDFISNQHYVLLQIKDTTLNFWGDLCYWNGKKSLKKSDFNKITDSTFYFNGFKYKRIKNGADYLDQKGNLILNNNPNSKNSISKLIAKNILVGKYAFNDEEINFNKDGKVIGLPYFQDYSIKIKVGTHSPYYPHINIIKTNKGTWRFSKNKNKIIFTKFNDKIIKSDFYNLSKVNFELTKIK